VALPSIFLFSGDDIRRRPLIERKTALKWVLRRPRQYVDHTEGDGEQMFAVVCKLGLDGIVSKKLSSGYKSGPSKAWLRSKIQSLWLQHGPLTKRFDRTRFAIGGGCRE
jgi:ATP-dependent DNA ligase